MDNELTYKIGLLLAMLQQFYFSKKKEKLAVLSFVLGFVLIQSYVLYASTSHVFHDTMPMCPVCVAVKSYEHSVVNTTVAFYNNRVPVIEEHSLTLTLLRLIKPHAQSRAPPLPFII